MDKILDTIMGALGGIIDFLVGWIVDWLIAEFLIPIITSCRETGDKLFENCINNVLTVLQKSPNQWNSDGWSFIISNVNKVFITFGCQLVVLFFLIGFISESMEPKHDVRFKTIIKAFFKIMDAEYFVI